MSLPNGNGFTVKGWKDLLTIATLVVLGVSLLSSAVVWGVLIDLKSQTNSDRITRIETQSEARPDSFTGTEGRALERRIGELERRVDALD